MEYIIVEKYNIKRNKYLLKYNGSVTESVDVTGLKPVGNKLSRESSSLSTPTKMF